MPVLLSGHNLALNRYPQCYNGMYMPASLFPHLGPHPQCSPVVYNTSAYQPLLQLLSGAPALSGCVIVVGLQASTSRLSMLCVCLQAAPYNKHGDWSGFSTRPNGVLDCAQATTAGHMPYLNGLLYIKLLVCGSHLVWQASQLLRSAAPSAAAVADTLPAAAAALVWYSCRCLCLGFFLQMMKSFPLRLVAKQCSQIFFTAFFTFISG